MLIRWCYDCYECLLMLWFVSVKQEFGNIHRQGTNYFVLSVTLAMLNNEVASVHELCHTLKIRHADGWSECGRKGHALNMLNN